jgi:hypothetical protein
MSLVPVEPRKPAWIDVMGPAHELAVKLHETEFVPARLRKRPAAVMACILSGDEAGIGPMQSLRQIFVTDDGKVGMAAELMRSLVLREGHEIWAEDYTTTRVTMAGRRRGQENPSRVTWTMDDAKKAGLANRTNWSRYPRAMLAARATTELCRLLFADVIAGISYSMEELEDADELDFNPPAANGEDPSASTTTKRKAPTPRRSRAKESPGGSPPSSGPPPPPLPGEDEVPRDAAATTAEPPAPAAKSMPVDQEIAMRAREVGVDHHLVVEAVTDGRKKSAKELSGEEAAEVLDELKGLGEGRRRLIANPGEWPLLEDTDVEDAEIVPDGPPLPDEAGAGPAGDPGQWDGDTWRELLISKGVRPGDVLREAHKLAKEEGIAPPTSLGEIAKCGLAARLLDFVKGQAR